MRLVPSIGLLLAAATLLNGCGAGSGSGVTAASPSPLAPSASPTASPTPTLLPSASYLELAQEAGYMQYMKVQAAPGVTISFWLPGPYKDTNHWESGDYLDAAAERLHDYAYELFAVNRLITADDRAFHLDSPYANACAALWRTVDFGQVEFALRTGQDPQLAGMSLANYAALLSQALEQVRGESGYYQQESAPFPVPGFEAWRIITDFNLEDYAPYTWRVTFVDYILKAAERIWVLTFSVDTELFWESEACAYLADDFDLVARTFEMLPAAASLPPAAPVVTGSLVPLIRPTPTPVPLSIGIEQPVEISVFGTSTTLKVVEARETMKAIISVSVLPLGYVEPLEGNKIIAVGYQAEPCPSMPINPVLVDETRTGYPEGYLSDSGTHISTSDCMTWVFGVPLGSRHFTLLLPVTIASDRYYQVELDPILERLEGEPLPPPALADCIAQALSPGVVLVTWEVAGDPSQYEGAWIKDSAGWDVIGWRLAPGERSAHIYRLEADTHYVFQVMAVFDQETPTCTVEVTTPPRE